MHEATTSDVGDRVRLVRSHLRQHPEDGAAEDPTVHVERTGPLCFDATDGDGHRVSSDMPAILGGAGEHMTPGTLLRSALGTCDATAIALEAAARGIRLTRLEVTVSSRSDNRGLLGIDGIDAGPTHVVARYRLASDDADRDALADLVRHAEQHSPVLSALRRTLQVETEVHIG
jgi:uncharacterized OsmC-like protein